MSHVTLEDAHAAARGSRGPRTLSRPPLADEICFLSGRQGHRDPIRRDGDRYRPGGAGAVVDHPYPVGVSRRLRLHRRDLLLSGHHHARHDYGGLHAHRDLPRRLRQLSHPADGGLEGHGFPLRQHAELLGLSARDAGAGGELFLPGGPTGAGWTLYPPRPSPTGTPGHECGHHPDARLLDPVHRRLHHGRIELCGDGAAGRARGACR